MTFDRLIEKSSQNPIIIFDGYCVLCEKSIKWLMKIDQQKTLRFISSHHIPEAEFDSVVLLLDGNSYYKSDVAIALINKLEIKDFRYTWLKIIPKSIRDFFYRLTSKNRYALFGKKKTCSLPTINTKDQFIM